MQSVYNHYNYECILKSRFIGKVSRCLFQIISTLKRYNHHNDNFVVNRTLSYNHKHYVLRFHFTRPVKCTKKEL